MCLGESQKLSQTFSACVESLAKVCLFCNEKFYVQHNTWCFVKLNLLRSRKPGNLLILTPSLILLKSMASMAFSTRGMLSQMNPAMITSVVRSERRIPCNSNVCEQHSSNLNLCKRKQYNAIAYFQQISVSSISIQTFVMFAP